MPDVEDRRRFMHGLLEADGYLNDFEPKAEYAIEADWVIMNYLAGLLEREAAREEGADDLSEKHTCALLDTHDCAACGRPLP